MPDFDADKYLQEILDDAKSFAKKVEELNEELKKHQQLNIAQKVAYQGLDVQIDNTLVRLNEAFESLAGEIDSNRPVDIEYHLTRIQTLSNEGSDLIGKALDIAQQKKLEGADVLDDIKSLFTNLGQWIKKQFGAYSKHSTELRDSLKKSRGAFGLGDTMQTSFNNTKDKVGIHAGQKGHAVSKLQENLVRPKRPD